MAANSSANGIVAATISALRALPSIRNCTTIVHDRLAKSSQADLWSLRHLTEVANAHRSAVLRLENCVADVDRGVHQPHGADVERLRAVLQKTAASIHIVVSQ